MTYRVVGGCWYLCSGCADLDGKAPLDTSQALNIIAPWLLQSFLLSSYIIISAADTSLLYAESIKHLSASFYRDRSRYRLVPGSWTSLACDAGA